MLWWLQADLRSVGPPTSKMHLRGPSTGSTCYECFNATVRSFIFRDRSSMPRYGAVKNVGNTAAVIKLPGTARSIPMANLRGVQPFQNRVGALCPPSRAYNRPFTVTMSLDHCIAGKQKNTPTARLKFVSRGDRSLFPRRRW